MSANIATPVSPAGAGSSPSPLFGLGDLNAGKTPHKCPICEGHGQVAGGFFNDKRSMQTMRRHRHHLHMKPNNAGSEPHGQPEKPKS